MINNSYGHVCYGAGCANWDIENNEDTSTYQVLCGDEGVSYYPLSYKIKCTSDNIQISKYSNLSVFKAFAWNNGGNDDYHIDIKDLTCDSSSLQGYTIMTISNCASGGVDGVVQSGWVD